MKKSRCAVSLLFVLVLISGCASLTGTQKTLDSKDVSLFQQHMTQGERLEKENNITSALEEYKLASAIDSRSKIASRKIKAVEKMLRKRAQIHYEKGVVLDKKGKYEMARKEYLAALQNWPDHSGAKKMLTTGMVEEERGFIVHTIRPGESISRLALRYYGNYKKYPLIAKFNAMKNATQVRVGQTVKVPEIDGISVTELEKRQSAYLASRERAEPSIPGTGTLSKKEQPDFPGETPDPLDRLQPMDEEEAVEPVTTARDETPVDETQINETQVDAAPVEARVDEVHAGEAALDSLSPELDTVGDEGVADESSLAGTAEGNGVSLDTLAMVAPEDIQPPVVPKETFDDVEIYLAQGIELFNQKEYEAAIIEFDLAKKADPGNPKVLDSLYQSHFQQGLLHHSSDAFLEAAKSFEAARENNPDCEKCSEYMEKSLDTYKEKHYTMGIFHFGKEQLKKAITEWQLVTDIDPGYKDVTPNLKKAEMLYQRLETIKKSDN
ncbi:MAG: tetratricopeptide repeat protein [Desulfobacterium sp.]|nr:tetratricopeptide repeat protein [Desulfobacterium sp.]